MGLSFSADHKWVFVDDALEGIVPEQTTLIINSDDPNYHHLVRVSRVKPGEKLVLVSRSNAGVVAPAVVTVVDKRALHCLFTGAAATPPRPNTPQITVVLALPKADTTSVVLEKLVELGVERIVPCWSERSQRWLKPETEKSTLQKWQRQLELAACQSEQAVLPQLVWPVGGLKEVLEQLPQERLNLLAAEPGLPEMPEPKPLLQVLSAQAKQSVVLAVGPEGGWSPRDLALFQQLKFQPFTLGETILKVPTAVVAAIGVINAWALAIIKP